jgi:hypothetical protein
VVALAGDAPHERALTAQLEQMRDRAARTGRVDEARCLRRKVVVSREQTALAVAAQLARKSSSAPAAIATLQASRGTAASSSTRSTC